ncbi:MAG: NAD(P)H-binding protein [Solirubrobacterales bacterium]|nr:NAD(P)H-binding protein [Solirubrobacterales bacterium]
MNVLVVGGHGQIALRLLRLLADRGDAARGLVRNAGHAGDLEAAGATPVVLDLEGDADLAEAVRGADAVVFAAGAGPGSGPERKRTVDLGGATKLIDACAAAGVSRYLMISAMGVDRPGHSGPMAPYYEAKREADAAVRDAGLDYTIVRPGRLTDDPGTGRVEVGSPLDHGGEVSRDDVAATLLAALDEPRSAGVQLDLIGGATPIDAALASLIAR